MNTNSPVVAKAMKGTALILNERLSAKISG